MSLLVLEVKFELGTREKRADAFGQVAAEYDGIIHLLSIKPNAVFIFLPCDYHNDRLNFPSAPIYGILCDGKTFVLSFDGETSPPTLSQCLPHFWRPLPCGFQQHSRD
jgi:hypothetical protein